MLEKIVTGRTCRPRRIVIHGPDGVGKTTLASQAPSPLILATEDGAADIGCDRTPVITDYGTFLQWMTDLLTEQHNYKTVVVDSLDWLERLNHAYIAAKYKQQSIEGIPYGKGYQFALEEWDYVLKGFNRMRDNGIGIILIAHSKVDRFAPPDGEPYDRYDLALHKHATPVVREWADEVLFATYQVTTVTQDAGFGATRTKAVGEGERILWTTGRPTHMAKRRIEMPDVIPMAWSEYAKYLPQPVAAS